MHNPCMATTTISLKTEAYEKLKEARRYPTESFTQVVLRGKWNEETVTGAELLELDRKRGPLLTEAELDSVEEAKRQAQPPVDKWQSG